MRQQKSSSLMTLLGRFVLAGMLFIIPLLMFANSPTAVHAVAPCSVSYTLASEWGTGFQADVMVTNNTTAAIDGWDLTWTFANGESVTSGWNATFAQTGAAVSVSNVAGHWNGTLAANGGTASFGFQAGSSGTTAVPTDFAVNGVPCTDSGTNTPVPTDEPTVVPTTEPTVDPTVEPTVEPTVPSGTAACTVDYVFGNQWSSGAQVDVTITNNGTTAVSGWDLVWTLGAGEQFDSGWNASFSNVGQTVTASNPASQWNGTIAANGGTASFGFQLIHNGTPSVPASFSLNGDVCGGDTVTPTPTVDPTVDPTTTPTVDPTVDPTVTPTVEPTITATPQPGVHVANPFAGADGYLNPDYTALVEAQASQVGGELGAKMSLVASYPSAVWMDRIGAIYGTDTRLSLEEHLDAALLQQNGSTPLYITVVIYDLPNRDCAADASNGELLVAEGGMERYQTEYIDVIAGLFAQPKYSDLRIVTVIEPDSLPNLITNLNVPACAEAKSTRAYEDGIQYAINKLHAVDNVYIYLDIGHSGWLGWDSNFGPAVDLYTETVLGTDNGLNSIDGFVSNTSGYTPVAEPFLPDNTLVIPGENLPVRSSDFYEWNPYFSELEFVTALRDAFIAAGFPEGIGMLVDTSRNGWGGTARPTAVSTALTINEYVDESRIDLRPHRGGWCNQTGAGIGERPTAAPAPGVDAYIWVKPPGESDGVSESGIIDPDDPAKRFDAMCDPTAQSTYNNAYPTNALAGAPHAGRWFDAQFQMLVENAYPPLGE